MEIKVGDTVAVIYRDNIVLRKVVRETKTQWVVNTKSGSNEMKFKKSNLRQVGGSGFFPMYISPLTLELKEKWQEKRYKELSRGILDRFMELNQTEVSSKTLYEGLKSLQEELEPLYK